jgi:hypothetical protein
MVWLVEIQDANGGKEWVQGSSLWIPCLGGELPNENMKPTKDCGP